MNAPALKVSVIVHQYEPDALEYVAATSPDVIDDRLPIANALPPEPVGMNTSPGALVSVYLTIAGDDPLTLATPLLPPDALPAVVAAPSGLKTSVAMLLAPV